MDVAAKLAEAQIVHVAIVDDDLSARITIADLEATDPHVAALLNDRADPDREQYVALLLREGKNTAQQEDLVEPLAEESIRTAAPERIRRAAEAVLTARLDRAEPVQRVISLLMKLGIADATIDRYPTTELPHDKIYDLIVVDYFLEDTATEATLRFIREALATHGAGHLPLQIILMSSHDEQLKADFKTIRPELKISSSRMRILEKPKSESHLAAWRAALWQLASDRSAVVKLECFIGDTGRTLVEAASATARKLWELDLQAMDLLHELASKDNDDYVRYVEDAVSRQLLSGLEGDGGMRLSLQQLDAVFVDHRSANLLSPPAEIGDSRAAIKGLMHSMEWREGAVGLPAFPTDVSDMSDAAKMERARWIRKHLRFGMVLRDQTDTKWLNITQACDLAQAKDTDIGSSTVLFVRGQHSLPASSPNGEYFVSMSAMMANSENHVLTWNLRDVRTESILSFSSTYGQGWQVVGELRPDVAQNIAARYGARMARVGLPVTLAAWWLEGVAVRVRDLLAANKHSLLTGLELKGHAVQRAKSKNHELHLDRASLHELLNIHGATVESDFVGLLMGVSIKPTSKQDVGGGAKCVYCQTPPRLAGEAREALDDERWLQEERNADKIVVLLWSAT